MGYKTTLVPKNKHSKSFLQVIYVWSNMRGNFHFCVNCLFKCVALKHLIDEVLVLCVLVVPFVFFPWINVEHDLCFKRTSKSALNVLNSKHAFIMVFKGQMLGMKIRNKPCSTLGGCGASYKSELVVYCKEH